MGRRTDERFPNNCLGDFPYQIVEDKAIHVHCNMEDKTIITYGDYGLPGAWPALLVFYGIL